jgi:hypothetical protein
MVLLRWSDAAALEVECLKGRITWKRKCRWEDNINVYLKEIGYKIVDWIYLAEDRDQLR